MQAKSRVHAVVKGLAVWQGAVAKAKHLQDAGVTILVRSAPVLHPEHVQRDAPSAGEQNALSSAVTLGLSGRNLRGCLEWAMKAWKGMAASSTARAKYIDSVKGPRVKSTLVLYRALVSWRARMEDRARYAASQPLPRICAHSHSGRSV